MHLPPTDTVLSLEGSQAVSIADQQTPDDDDGKGLKPPNLHPCQSLTFHLLLGSSDHIVKDVERPLVLGLANRPRLF